MRQVLLLSAAVVAALVFATPAAAQGSGSPIPGYNGDCRGCTGYFAGANAWYCSTTQTCWTTDKCGGQCSTNTTCFHDMGLCPSGPTRYPQYDGNCTGCVDNFPDPLWYCGSTKLCWSAGYCMPNCNVTCFAVPSSCPASTNAPSGTAVPSGEIPAFNGNCHQCTSTTAGNGFYCMTSGVCWASKDGCSTTCGAVCVAYTYQCSV